MMLRVFLSIFSILILSITNGLNSRRPDLSYGVDYTKKFNLTDYGLFDLNLSHRYIGGYIDWAGSKNAFVKNVDLVDLLVKKISLIIFFL